MPRTQITLNDDQYRFLVEFSKQTGKSISAIIRKAVDHLRSEEKTPNRQVLKLVGAFEADRPDVSVHHDEILWGEDRNRMGKS
ncbi:MAG: ribbon-helix-helix domain-containing protein [Candidatus Riflebacteria bacterium]|nr:ribbon-helix-helix domain-containing protein [Candidatus Riflebacteria bacterium]